MPFDEATLEVDYDTLPEINADLMQSRIDADVKALARAGVCYKEIIWDEEAKVIRIGDHTFGAYTRFKNVHGLVDTLTHAHKVHSPSYHPKWDNKWMSAILKGSPSRFFKHFNKLQYKHFVAPYADILTKICYVPGYINSNALKQIRAHEPILREVYGDGLHNILPIVAATGKSPQELKKELGAKWKVLSKNSLNKNKHIVMSRGHEWSRGSFSISAEEAGKLAEMPTTVLKVLKGSSVEHMQHISKHYRGSWSSKMKPWRDGTYNFIDTKRMAAQLDKPFDPLWTPRKIKEKHDEYTKEMHRQKYSDKPIEWLQNLPRIVEHEGYVARLLDNRRAIANEGVEMGHCVGSYAGSVANGSYLVYAVSKVGKPSSTLGISVNQHMSLDKKVINRFYIFNQHYGRFNKCLEDEAEKQLGKMVIDILNKKETK